MPTVTDVVQVENIPVALRERPQWLLWTYFGRNGDRRKVPISAETYKATSVTDPASWSPFPVVLEAFEASPDPLEGIGFCFTLQGGLVGVDLDDCVDETGHVAPWALDIIQHLGSYTEISPSGTGVKIFMRGFLPPGYRRKGKIEVYDSGRFFTVTGAHLSGTPAEVCDNQDALLDFYHSTFGEEEEPQEQPHAAQDGTENDFPGSDDELLKHASSLASGHSGAKFKRLWAGRWDDDYDSASEADLALCNMLAWYTTDVDRIDRLFRRSKLYREKWDRADYRAWTIGKSLRDRTSSYAETVRQAEAGEEERTDEPPLPDGDDEHLTELGNAARFIKQHHQVVRYCVEWGKWLLWDGSRWAVSNKQQIYPLARETVRSILHEAAEQENKKQRKLYTDWALKSETASQINNMLTLAQMDCLIAPDVLDLRPFLLNCANGTVSLETGELLKPRQDWLITRKTQLKYDPDATCPVFEEFLDTIMQGRQELIDFLQLALGYSLTGDTREQCFFLLYGAGQNGKSTLLEILDEVFNEYATTADFSTFLHKEYETVRNDLARLRGARFVIAVETDEGKRLGESVIKQITGGDKMTARFLFQENFEFRPVLKLWLAANHKPTIRGTDFAIWRRVRLIPFMKTFTPEERDKTIKDRLREELPGILAWCVRGAMRWFKEGLVTPEAVLLATEEYRQEQDQVSMFISEMCTKSDTASTAAGRLFEAFQKWSGMKSMTQTAFGRKLSDLGYQKDRDKTTGRIVWRGLFLHEPTE